MSSLSGKAKLHIAVTVLVMVFIFVHSAMPGKVSGAESNAIVRLIAYITGLEAEPLKLIVRKAAHFTEFAVLGGCLLVNVRDWRAAKSKVSTGSGSEQISSACGSEQIGSAYGSEQIGTTSGNEQMTCECKSTASESGQMTCGCKSTSLKRMCLTAWLLGTLYAVTDEIHQLFVPERACSVIDMCIDSAGVVTGAVIVALVMKMYRIRYVK